MDEIKKGFYVHIAVEGLDKDHYQIGDVEPFLYETGTSDTAEFSATVASGAESGFKNIPVLEPDDSPPRLFWVEWGVKDGCRYQIKIPTGTDRLGLDEDKDVGFLTNEKSPYFDPDPRFGFWIVANFYPAINAKNYTPNTLTPKVWFQGKKYDIIKVTDQEVITKLKNYERGISPSIPFTRITIGGVRTD